MREDMAWRLVSLLLPVTLVAGMAAGTDEISPVPNVSITLSDGLVIVEISSLGNEDHSLILRKNDSTEEKSEIVRVYGVRKYIIPPNDLLPEQTYCVKTKFNDTPGPYSPEECFTAPAKAPPYNLRMEALDVRYLLKWDWDFDKSPNVTFSVEKCNTYGTARCTKIEGCENITTTQCRCLTTKKTTWHFRGTHILRASVYDHQRQERSSSVIQFNPSEDTVISAPKDVKMRIINGELFINVSAPEGFKDDGINSYCNWLIHLKYWINSTHNSEVRVKENKLPFFKIDSLEPSTTYCVKAKMKCMDSDRSSLYSEVHCITTDPRSHLVAWLAGFAVLGIVVISVVIYVCLCPLKRYIKHIFVPSNNLPSSIEKGFGESNCIKHSFFLHEEENTDLCYIVQNSCTDDLVEITYKNTSRADSQDSGNCSNEGQTTGETATYSK